MKTKGSHHLLKDSKDLREFLAIKGIKFERSEGSTNLLVYDLTSQQVFDLGIEYSKTNNVQVSRWEEQQINALKTKIYESLIANPENGLGEMGACRDEAKRIVDEWVAENSIKVESDNVPSFWL